MAIKNNRKNIMRYTQKDDINIILKIRKTEQVF